MPTDYLRELTLLTRSRYGLIGVESREEERVKSLVRHLADQLGLPLFLWSHSMGLRRDGEPSSVYNTQRLISALTHIKSSTLPALYFLQEATSEFNEPITLSLMKDLSEKFVADQGAIILSSSSLDCPESLRQHVGIFRLPPPRPDEFKTLLTHLVRDLRQRVNIRVDLSPAELGSLIRNLQGLTLLEAEKVLTKAIIEDELLCGSDIRRVIEAKKDIVEREGLLEYYPVEEMSFEIAGLNNVREWLEKRKPTVLDPESARKVGLSFPKGLLLLGVPGTGKSLTAKTVAMEWNLPLLKMDPASLYNKYMGETEKNFRRAMATAEKMAPVVLWIDEIEKAFASNGDTDGGASLRVLGTFLSWLQDRTGDVFVVATANDVSRLPPELLRKGRFDEVFFVDLPTDEVRVTILRTQLKRRNIVLSAEELNQLANESGGFSGAELEQVVVSALHTAFARRVPLDARLLWDELKQTVPLSITMKERIEALREWALSRATPAHTP
jgi:MoxR-like ATPase